MSPEAKQPETPRTPAQQLGLEDGAFNVVRSSGEVQTGWQVQRLHEVADEAGELVLMATIVRDEPDGRLRKRVTSDDLLSWQSSEEGEDLTKEEPLMYQSIFDNEEFRQGFLGLKSDIKAKIAAKQKEYDDLDAKASDHNRGADFYDRLNKIKIEIEGLTSESVEQVREAVTPVVKQKIDALKGQTGTFFERDDIDAERVPYWAMFHGKTKRDILLGQVGLPPDFNDWSGSSDIVVDDKREGGRKISPKQRITDIAVDMLAADAVPGFRFGVAGMGGADIEPIEYKLDGDRQVVLTDKAGREKELPLYKTVLGQHRTAALMALYGPYHVIKDAELFEAGANDRAFRIDNPATLQ